jgi:hypothetical protein
MFRVTLLVLYLITSASVSPERPLAEHLQGDKRMAEPEASLGKSTGDYIRQAGAYSILLAFLAIGATIASINWTSAYAKLQVDLRRAQEEIVQARAELSAVRSEYAQYQAQSQSVFQTVPIASGGTGLPEASGAEGVESPEVKGTNEVTVYNEKTESLFGNDLLISMVQTSFEGSPLRHKAIAIVGSPGYPGAKIDREDVGYELVYDGKKGKYAVRVTSMSTFSATFLVTRLSDAS